ncbi:TIGR02300 family protein [Methylobacterium sp. Leaf118]|uniref:TIGR02300 family protein n=1 Tax=Methylobacterium sp. Leaf118 TaxID=2876562 RepID=UPI001E623C87|nr:TIGR02300 family protein [Methylobacterium sp. Leaf118]
MARPELGVKRQCMNCGAKFYDLDRDPATCPKCGTVYQVASSRVAPPIASRAQEDEEDEEEKTGPELVSLDEAETTEDESDISVDVDDDESSETTTGDDDTFLEEEDGDDDVSDLIDNDSDGDEEG